MKAVILAGGIETALTDERPKPMIEVLDQPIIEWQIKWFKKFRIDEFVICVGYLKEHIIDYIGSGNKFGVKVGYAVEEEPLKALAEHSRMLKVFWEERVTVSLW